LAILAAIRRALAGCTLYLIPASDETRAISLLEWQSFYSPQLEELLRTTPEHPM
jgi:hypothetical protein